MTKNHKPNSKSEFISVFQKGDTLIEVMFAVAIFGLAAVGTISLMNRGLATTQNSLETTMARQEIDAQAESLRFLHSAYLTEPKKNEATPDSEVCTNPSSYRDLWKCLISEYVYPSDAINQTNSVIREDPDFYTRVTSPGERCDDLFRANSNTAFSLPSKSFILNPRRLDISDLEDENDIRAVLKQTINKGDVLKLAGTYPRLLYNVGNNLSDAAVNSGGNQITYNDATNANKTLTASEGIWITGVASPSGVKCYNEDALRPDYYDFHIQTCWDSVASDSATTIGSTVRLFNPDQVTISSKKNAITFTNTAWNKWDNYCDNDLCTNHPYNGYDLGSTIHTDTFGENKLVLTGYGESNANEGLYIPVNASDVMTVKLALDISTFDAHPGGYFLVKLGPLNAVIPSDKNDEVRFYQDNKTVQELPDVSFVYDADYGSVPAGGFDTFLKAVEFTGAPIIVLEKSGTHYKGYLSGNEGEYVEFDDNQTNDLQLAFWMNHFAHDCNIIYNATATVDITLPMTSVEENGCYRIDPDSVNQSIDLPEEPTPPEPEPQPEPESDPDIEETIVAAAGSSLQYFDIKFSLPNIGVGSMKIPHVAWVANGATGEPGTCGIEFSNHQEFHCMYPYSKQQGSTSYADGKFIIYLDRNSLTNDASVTYFGSGPAISDFWNYNGLKTTIYFYDRIMYFGDTVGHEEELARYKISSDSARVIDNNGRYWILARIYGNPGSANYWADRLEIINQRTNRDPASFL